MSERIQFDYAVFMALMWRIAAKRINTWFEELLEDMQ